MEPGLHRLEVCDSREEPIVVLKYGPCIKGPQRAAMLEQVKSALSYSVSHHVEVRYWVQITLALEKSVKWIPIIWPRNNMPTTVVAARDTFGPTSATVAEAGPSGTDNTGQLVSLQGVPAGEFQRSFPQGHASQV